MKTVAEILHFMSYGMSDFIHVSHKDRRVLIACCIDRDLREWTAGDKEVTDEFLL